MSGPVRRGDPERGAAVEQEYPPESVPRRGHATLPGRAASAPIISILCYSAQDGGAGSGKRRNSEYFGSAREAGEA